MKGAWMGNVLFQEWSAKKKSDGMYLSGEGAEKSTYSAIYRYIRYVNIQHHSHVAVSLLEVDDGALGEVERDLGHGDVVARLGARPPPRRTPRSRPGTRRPTNRAPRALIEGESEVLVSFSTTYHYTDISANELKPFSMTKRTRPTPWKQTWEDCRDCRYFRRLRRRCCCRGPCLGCGPGRCSCWVWNKIY